MLQLSGRTANDLLIAAMERKVAAEPASEDAKKLLAEAQRYKEQGADKPFLDVWFADAQNGYAVGAYNLIVRTRDGGKTWESVVRPDRQPEILQPLRDPPGGRRAVHRRRRRPGAEARRRSAAIPRVDGPLQRQLFRRDRRRICGRRLRPARQRLPQRRPRRDVEQGRRRTAGVGRRRDAHRGRDDAARRCRRPRRGQHPTAAARSARWRFRRRCRSPESPMRAGASLRSSGRAVPRSPR